VIGRLLLMIGGGLVCWVLVALPARALLDDAEQARRVITFSGTCLLVCLVPALLTLVWTRHALDQSPDAQLLAVLGGTGIRLSVVLLSGWLLTTYVPIFRDSSFWFWLLGAYLFTLTLEIFLLLAGRPASVPKS